jgi:hypothetical protein
MQTVLDPEFHIVSQCVTVTAAMPLAVAPPSLLICQCRGGAQLGPDKEGMSGVGDG